MGPAAAKSLQSFPTVRLHRRQPTRLPRPWDSPGKNTGVGCHFLLQCMKVKSESEVALLCLTLSYQLLCPWDFPGKRTGVGCHCLLCSKEQVSFNFVPPVTIGSDFGAPKIKSVTVSIVSSFICDEAMEQDVMILIFGTLSFKPTFSLSSFTFIKRLLSSSLFSAIRVVSSAYLRLLIFLPAILIPASASSSPVFLMMHSAYKLNKQGDNIQP